MNRLKLINETGTKRYKLVRLALTEISNNNIIKKIEARNWKKPARLELF